MNLSYSERRELAAIDRMLSRDVTLRAVAALFAVPPPASSGRAVREPPAPQRGVTGRLTGGVTGRVARRGTRSVARRPTSTVVIVLLAVAGLVCAVVTAPLNAVAISDAGLALAVCAGVLFIVVTARWGNAPDGSHPASKQRSTSVGRGGDV